MIAASKGYDDPSADDRERVKTRWLATVAAAASVSTLGEVARAASSGWGAKAAGWALALAAGAAGVFALLPEDQSPVPVERVERQTSVRARGDVEPQGLQPEPPRAAPAVPSAAPAVPSAAPTVPSPAPAAATLEAREVEAAEPALSVPPPAPAKPSAPRRPAPAVEQPVAPALEPAMSQASPPDQVAAAPEEATAPTAAEQVEPSPALDSEVESRQLGEETLLLSKIRRNLRDGAAARALEGLAEYRQRFEKPLLGMEAAALRVDALCRSGNVQAGRAEAEAFYATWPSSPLEQRVRAACP